MSPYMKYLPCFSWKPGHQVKIQDGAETLRFSAFDLNVLGTNSTQFLYECSELFAESYRERRCLR